MSQKQHKQIHVYMSSTSRSNIIRVPRKKPSSERKKKKSYKLLGTKQNLRKRKKIPTEKRVSEALE